jgi:hypothetical protein
MNIIMPTCNSHATIAEYSAALLAKYWPKHPPLTILHYERVPNAENANYIYNGPQPSSAAWLPPVVDYVKAHPDPTFLLTLDDYGVCGPVQSDLIAKADQLLRADQSVGMFPLSWYPARRIGAYGQWVELASLPVLLQAAVWRRDWFLELAAELPPQCSASAFERAATQAAKRLPKRRIVAADFTARMAAGHQFIDSMDKTHWPLPYHNLCNRGDCSVYSAFLASEGFAVPTARLAPKHTKGCGGCNRRKRND